MIHGLERFGPKMLGVTYVIECLNCGAKEATITAVEEDSLDDHLDYSRQSLTERIGACKAEGGQHRWSTNVIQTRRIAGLCMCDACWPPATSRPL